MKSITWYIGSMFIGMFSLFSCSSQPKSDPLMELLLDYQKEVSLYRQSWHPEDSAYTLPCFDENSTDSTFITLFFNSGREQEEEGKRISICCVPPYLIIGHMTLLPPPPPPMPDQEQNETEMLLLRQKWEQDSIQWQHKRDSLGHRFGPEFRGMINEGRLKVLVYGSPEDIAPFVAQHKLQYDASVFRYMELKDEELYESCINIDPINWLYQITDTLGHFEYKGAK